MTDQQIVANSPGTQLFDKMNIVNLSIYSLEAYKK